MNPTPERRVSWEQRTQLLTQLCGTVCVDCGGTKDQFFWLCHHCYERFLDIPEEDTLARACHAHLYAADKFMAVVKRRKALLA